MASQQKPRNPSNDPYAQRGKQLTSAAQRLRGWVGSDPSRSVELADALVELNTHRLLGHDYAAAASDTQDALRRSAELLTAKGPIGPYTSVDDAVRYLTAAVHVAVTQAGLGLPEAAGRTIASMEGVKEQLAQLPLQERLSPVIAIWALSCTARSALASGDVGAANGYADAALARLDESGLRADHDSSYLVIDTDRLASDSRWAAGRPEESLAFLHEAKQRYDQVVDGRLAEPARLSPALVERLAEPLFGVYRDMADRLVATGEVDLGLVTRRELVALLRMLGGRLGQSARVQLAAALTDLADDLVESDRLEEAEAAIAEAAETMPDSAAAASPHLLLAATRARVLTRAGRSAEAVPMLRTVMSAVVPDSPPTARAVALHALGEALRSTADAESSRAVEQEGDRLARDLLGADLGSEDIRPAVRDAARGVVSRGSRVESWEPVPMSRSYAATTASAAVAETAEIQLHRRETAAWLDGERAEAHRLELELLEQARVEATRRQVEQAEAERLAAERAAEERARAERAQQAEAERRIAAEEAERAERKRRRAERLEEHRLEVERREAERREAERREAEQLEAERQADRKAAQADTLAVALREWHETKARGDRRGARAANERVVELLRPRAQADIATFGVQLVDALEELARARLRSGDVWGSRGPAREARDLAKILSR